MASSIIGVNREQVLQSLPTAERVYLSRVNSHNLTASSIPALANVQPSGENATEQTQSLNRAGAGVGMRPQRFAGRFFKGQDALDLRPELAVGNEDPSLGHHRSRVAGADPGSPS